MGADIILYVSTSLTSPSTSAFFSAEDADSLPNLSSHTKVEGAFYVWEYEELEKVLGDDHTVSLFAKHFGVEVSGNVDPSHDIQGELVGKVRCSLSSQSRRTSLIRHLGVERVGATIHDRGNGEGDWDSCRGGAGGLDCVSCETQGVSRGAPTAPSPGRQGVFHISVLEY